MRKIIFFSSIFFLFSCEKKGENSVSGPSEKWCTEAHQDLEKLMSALKETVAKGEKGTIHVPDKKAYIQNCVLLPEKAQKCLVVSFAQKNTKTCQHLNLRGEDKKNFEKLISGK